MNIVTKDFPVTDIGVTDEYPNGSFEVILSAPTVDRDKELIDPKAFEPLPTHITFDTDHSMTCDTVVGSGTPYYAVDGTLRVKGGYCSDERSQTIRQKVAEGHIRTTSVTFMDAEREKDEKGIVHIKRAELLNGTFTPIPSNREAVVLTAKSIVAKEGRRNSEGDMALIQSAHDAMTSLGAACAMKSHRVSPKAMSRVDAKAIIGSVEALQARVSDALEDTYPRGAYLRGVLPNDANDGGTVVFDAWDDNYDLETWQQTYTDDGAVVTLTGDPTEVDVLEIVLPDADADRETDETLKSADKSAETTAASAAVASADESADLLAKFTANAASVNALHFGA